VDTGRFAFKEVHDGQDEITLPAPVPAPDG
jgi:hypothetical protein